MVQQYSHIGSIIDMDSRGSLLRTAAYMTKEAFLATQPV
ncbi:hypothetical protein OHAE_4321 [Ochrobactrum soli]|uniref:Uncharacterized protein n=1 Tax=Ochrobactrum soli TaxID=2448455 RepID=A0A2P9HBQ7_9HYPH|nr:hypothetical protein OHAE_4321 [[Ochrobactrum] soli]